MTTLPDRPATSYEPLHRFNRSEAPTSVALAMVLAEPELGKPLLEALARTHPWRMWPSECGAEIVQEFSLSDAALEATPLFFPFRDIPPKVATGDTWPGEIDVVAVMPGHVAIGFELKVLSTTGGLAGQMNAQVAGLKRLAKVYDCRFLCQVALASTFPGNLPQRVNRTTLEELSDAILAIGGEQERGLLAALDRQIDHVVDLTRPASMEDVTYVTLEKLRRMGQGGHDAKWVGVLEGLEKLKVHSRWRWRVTDTRKSPNWYPLQEVVKRIEALL